MPSCDANCTVVTITYTVITPRPRPSLLPVVTCWTLAAASLTLLLDTFWLGWMVKP